MAAMLGSRLSAGCCAPRTAPVRHVAAVAPRVNGITPVVMPSTSFLGGSFSSCVRPQPVSSRGALVVMANSKKSLGCTKQGTRRARRRTSGFRTRMQTKTGRRVLKLRRKKGRKNICPASTRSSAGKKQ